MALPTFDAKNIIKLIQDLPEKDGITTIDTTGRLEWNRTWYRYIRYFGLNYLLNYQCFQGRSHKDKSVYRITFNKQRLLYHLNQFIDTKQQAKRSTSKHLKKIFKSDVQHLKKYRAIVVRHYGYLFDSNGLKNGKQNIEQRLNQLELLLIDRIYN